jgi:endonuclease III
MPGSTWSLSWVSKHEAFLEVRELTKPLGLHNQRSNYLIERARLVVKGSDNGILCDREALRQQPGAGDYTAFS